MTQWTYYGNTTPGAKRLCCVRCGTPWQGTAAEASTCTVCYAFVTLPA